MKAMRTNYSEFLTEVLEEASAVARDKFGSVTAVTKAADNNQVLTEADLAIGKLLIRSIQNAYPGDSIIDEEAGVIDKKSDYVWVIDPIDGTSNFAQGVPLYGIMVGLLQRGEPVAVLNRTSRIWDNVAQHVLIQEAGGIYTDFFGKSVDYSTPLTKVGLNFSFCAAAPGLHNELQKIIDGVRLR